MEMGQTVRALADGVCRSIEDAFAGGKIDPEMAQKPWVIAVLSVLLALAIANCLAAAIYIIRDNFLKRFSAALLVQEYICQYDYTHNTVRIIPRQRLSKQGDAEDDREYVGGFDIPLSQFLEIFSTSDTCTTKGLKVETWLKGIARGSDQPHQLPVKLNPSKSKILFRKSRYPHPDNAILYEGKGETASGNALFTIRMMPHISRARRSNPSRFMTYPQFLAGFRKLMIDYGGRCQFLYVGLYPDEKARQFASERDEQEYQTSLIADFLARRLTRNSYLIKVDDRSILMVSLKSRSDESYDSRLKAVRDDVYYFLSFNSMEDRYTPLIGRTIHEKGAVIKPLADYVRKAREDAISRAGRSPVSGLDKDGPMNEEARMTLIENAMKNRTYKLYFTPFFSLDYSPDGSAYMYLMTMEPFLSRGELTQEQLVEECLRLDLFDEMADGVTERIRLRQPAGQRITILAPWKLGYTDALLKSEFQKKIGNADLCLSFSSREIERYGGEKLIDTISRVNSNGIYTALSMENRPPAIDSSIMQLFSIFIVQGDRGESPVADMHARANTLSTLNYLKHYGKPIALRGLENEGECYFAKIHGAACVSSDALCPPSSIFERLDERGQGIISKVNARIAVRRN